MDTIHNTMYVCVSTVKCEQGVIEGSTCTILYFHIFIGADIHIICLYYNAISTHSMLIVVVFHALRSVHIVSLACVHFSANVLLIHVQSVFFYTIGVHDYDTVTCSVVSY